MTYVNDYRAIASGTYWSSKAVTFGFPDQSFTGWPLIYRLSSLNEPSGLTALREEHRQVARAYFGLIAEACGLSFTETLPAQAQIRVAFTSRMRTTYYNGAYHPLSGYGYYPATGRGGDLWLYDGQMRDPYEVGSRLAYIMAHELLHCLGGKHPHEGTYQLAPDRDSIWITLLSYREFPGDTMIADGVRLADPMGYPFEPRPLDVQMLEKIYP